MHHPATASTFVLGQSRDGQSIAPGRRTIEADRLADPDFPDLYADGAQVAYGPYGLSITFYLSDPDNPKKGLGETVGRVRVSAPLAEAVADILKTAVASGGKLPSTKTEQG